MPTPAKHAKRTVKMIESEIRALQPGIDVETSIIDNREGVTSVQRKGAVRRLATLRKREAALDKELARVRQERKDRAAHLMSDLMLGLSRQHGSAPRVLTEHTVTEPDGTTYSLRADEIDSYFVHDGGTIDALTVENDRKHDQISACLSEYPTQYQRETVEEIDPYPRSKRSESDEIHQADVPVLVPEQEGAGAQGVSRFAAPVHQEAPQDAAQGQAPAVLTQTSDAASAGPQEHDDNKEHLAPMTEHATLLELGNEPPPFVRKPVDPTTRKKRDPKYDKFVQIAFDNPDVWGRIVGVEMKSPGLKSSLLKQYGEETDDDGRKLEVVARRLPHNEALYGFWLIFRVPAPVNLDADGMAPEVELED